MMEALEEHHVLNINIENVKSNVIEDIIQDRIESSECHKSNGVECDKNTSSKQSEVIDAASENENCKNISSAPEINDKSHENLENVDDQELVKDQEPAIALDSEVTNVGNTIEESKNDTKQEINASECVENSNNAIDTEKEICSKHEVITEAIEIDHV